MDTNSLVYENEKFVITDNKPVFTIYNISKRKELKVRLDVSTMDNLADYMLKYADTIDEEGAFNFTGRQGHLTV